MPRFFPKREDFIQDLEYSLHRNLVLIEIATQVCVATLLSISYIIEMSPSVFCIPLSILKFCLGHLKLVECYGQKYQPNLQFDVGRQHLTCLFRSDPSLSRSTYLRNIRAFSIANSRMDAPSALANSTVNLRNSSHLHKF